MIISNILLGITTFFLMVNFLVAANPIERIVILYGCMMTILAIIFLNFSLEQNVLIDVILALILTKITLLIVVTKFRK